MLAIIMSTLYYHGKKKLFGRAKNTDYYSIKVVPTVRPIINP